MSSLKEWIECAVTTTRRPSALRLFSKLLYAWFVIYLLWNLPVHDLIWGRASFNMPVIATPGIINNIYYFLTYNGTLSHWVLLVHGLSALCALFGFLGVFARILVYFSAAMLYYSGYLAFNGGFVLCWIMSFYLIFANFKSTHPVSGVLNNLVITACMLQVFVVYGVAAWFKWQGTTWLEGSSVYYTLKMDHFSSWGIGEWLSRNYWLMLVLNYAGLFYQSLFAVVIWFKPIRNWYLIAGIGFHLFIVFIMGLWDFGIAMIITYSVFLSEEKAASILAFITRKKHQSKDSTIRSIV
jgi:hypothetical protein